MDGPDADDRQDTAGRTSAANGPGAAGRGNPGERPNRNVARGEATRGQLVTIATRMFAERGYEDTSIEAVLREAGVSRGSLYHHFASKEALFEAVAEEVETSVGAQTLAAASGSAGPVEALRAGFLAWIRLAADPVVQQTVLIDAPAVLGWRRWRELDEQSLGEIRADLTYAADAGIIERRHVDAFAHIVLAAANEVALKVARADDPAATLPDAESAFAEFLDRLLASPDGRS